MSLAVGTGPEGYEPLPPPAAVLAEMPLAGPEEATVRRRTEARAVLAGADDRLMVVVGPCSVHDPAAALDYAHRLAALGSELQRDLLVVLRVYCEKQRTVSGWKGLISDPEMDGGHNMAQGLRIARQLMIDVTRAGLPVACEWVGPVSPLYLSDLMTWGAIGARTTESQAHRELASWLPMPIGFKKAQLRRAPPTNGPRPPRGCRPVPFTGGDDDPGTGELGFEPDPGPPD